MKILLVEESRVIRQIVVRSLRQAGYVGPTVLHAEDGPTGLRLAREEDPDLVLCGWNVPGVSGPELISAIRVAVGGRRIGVVSAGVTSPAAAELAVRAGADFVLAKPFTPEQLAEAFETPVAAPTSAEICPDGPVPVPTPHAVRETLSVLLSREVEVIVGDPFSGEDAATTYAVYVDDRMRTHVVAVADLGFSARVGAAVGLVPAPFAEDAVRRGTLPEALAGNLDEVLNVFAAALNGAGSPHLRLYTVHHVGGDAPRDVVSYAAIPGRRLDLEVTIPSYGPGRLSFVAVP